MVNPNGYKQIIARTDVHARLKVAASKRGISMNDYIEILLNRDEEVAT